MTVHLIVAVSSNGVIGLNNEIPWEYDRMWFSMHTQGGVLVMGRKTWDSLVCKPSNCGSIIVVSRFKPHGSDSVHWCTTLASAMCLSGPQHTYIIGGGEIFRSALLLRLVRVLLVTHVKIKIEDRRVVELALPVHRRIFWESPTFQKKQLEYYYEMSTLEYK